MKKIRQTSFLQTGAVEAIVDGEEIKAPLFTNDVTLEAFELFRNKGNSVHIKQTLTFFIPSMCAHYFKLTENCMEVLRTGVAGSFKGGRALPFKFSCNIKPSYYV